MPLEFINPTELPEVTEPALDDIFIIVHDPDGVPTMGKVRVENLPIAGPAGPEGPPTTVPIAESDVTGLVADLAAKAPLASPALTGTPTAPTASVGDNTTKIATTAFVLANAGGGVTLPIAESDVTGLVADLGDKAPLASPALTGTPTAPTAANGTNNTQLATTAFVLANAGAGGGAGTVTHTAGALTAHAVVVGNGADDEKVLAAIGTTGQVLTSNGAGADPSFQNPSVALPIAESDVTNLTTDLAAKAPLASPALTGTPTAPTAAGGDNSTKIATTAFVIANGGAGTVTHTAGALTADRVVLGNGSADVKAGPAGTATQVLHGNASGAPAYSAVDLAADVTGVLPSANGGVPQALASTDTPQFARLGIGGAADASIKLKVTGGQFNLGLYDNGNSGAAKTINWNNGNEQMVTETASCTFTFTNPKDGGRYSLVRQTGAGGFTPVLPSNIAWIGGTPVYTTAASKVEVWTFEYVLAIDTYVGAYGSSAASTMPTLPLSVANGGTGVATLAAHGLLLGNGASNVVVSGAGTAGQVLTSNGASADPTFQGPIVQTTTSTGTVNDFALTANCRLLRCNNATALTLTGLTAGVDGQQLEIESVGAGSVALSDQAGGSTAANRLITGVGGSLYLLAGAGIVKLTYDATTARWVVTSAPGVGQLRCSAYNSSTQSVATATVTAITLDSESYDVGGFHSTSSNTSRLTIPAGGDGVYLVVGEITLAASAAGTLRQLSLALNGTAVDTLQFLPSTLSDRRQVLGAVSAVAGDYLEVLVYQDTGGALNVGSGSAAFVNRLTAIKMG